MSRSIIETATACLKGKWPRSLAGALCAVALGMGGLPAAAHGATPAVAAVQVAIAAAPSAADAQTFTLGMRYVVPPHVPGSKVRTPEGLAPLLAERLGRRLSMRPVAVPPAAGSAPGLPGLQRVDALLVPLEVGQADDGEETVVIPTGYRAGIMAIMRTDTDIRRWDDLRGRTVCLAEGSNLAGQMQARYGAIEKVFRAPADALLDLRIGGCDAAVHDSTMLEAILDFPEWKKFSARLPVQQERDLAFVLRRSDPAVVQAVQSQVREWRKTDVLAKLTKQSANDIAFEVYMDQEVPDCH